MDDSGVRSDGAARPDDLTHGLVDVSGLPLAELIRSDDGVLTDALRRAVSWTGSAEEGLASFGSAL